mmetsp:Transcript_9215/g.22807  ORF Transcript_9215/g.22807 Transcript_9215/m.22807 type:complete len:253 (-) Transcript_9215:34-792(-)
MLQTQTQGVHVGRILTQAWASPRLLGSRPRLCRLTTAQATTTEASVLTEEATTSSDARRSVKYVKTGRKDFFTVEGRMELAASPSLVYEVLTAYEACPDIFNNILTSETHRNAETGGLEVLQKCSWNFLAFSGTFTARMAVTEDADSRTLVFNLIHSSFMRDFEGRWAVKSLLTGSGSTTGSSDSDGEGEAAPTCIVEHCLSVKPSLPVPPPISYYTRSIFVKQVDAILQDLEREVRRRQAVAAAEATLRQQ